MHIKSLALVAAAVVTAGAAQAADLNKPAKVAVDYVKVCDAYGAGFFYIPGSDTCLKIGGFARLDVFTGGQSGNTVAGGPGLNTGPTRANNAIATTVRTDLQIDARTNTQYGLLRSFIDFHEDLGTSAGNATKTSIELDQGYVQFGGLTAGRTSSKSNFLDAEQNNQEYVYEAFLDNSVNLLAYTFTFGNGVTATIDMEDPTTAGYQSSSSGANNSSVRQSGATFRYGALNVPDFVGQLNVTQAWGEAQVAVVAHQDYGSTATPYTKEGFAVTGGILFNVPQIGPGDTIAFNGGYGSGAVGFVQSYRSLGGTGYDTGADAIVRGNSLKLSNSWEVGSSIVHHFTPTVDINLAPAYFSWNDQNLRYSQTQFSASIDWFPVKGLKIEPDFEYSYTSLNAASKADVAGGGPISNGSGYVFGVRIQRSF
jgi:hypothetical protein